MKAWASDDLGTVPPPLSPEEYGTTPTPLAAVPILKIQATPFAFREAAAIPRRQWLYGKHYVRKFVSTTIAPGGVGKTSLTFVEAAAMASGQRLLGCGSSTPCRVWLINLEDPADELERRMAAVMLHYRLTADDIGDRLFIDSGRQVPIKIAAKHRDVLTIAEPLVAELTREISARQIDVLIIDPFVSCHSVPENDNGAIDRVAKVWAQIADECNCSVELVHHVRKPANGSASEYTIDDARGAVALIGAVRSARVLNAMSREEAEKAEIDPKDRRSYFRVDDGKANMAPPVETAVWRRLVGVPLDNGTEDEPGDWVGVATAWEMPGALDGLSTASLRLVQDKIAAGEWAESIQANDWAGYAVAEVLGLDASTAGGKQRIKSLIKVWVQTKALRIERARDANKGRDKPMVRVGEWV